jgi:hypothetical protein
LILVQQLSQKFNEALILDVSICRLFVKDLVLNTVNRERRERKAVCRHIVKSDTEGPHIRPPRINLLLNACLDDFRRKVLDRAFSSLNKVILLTEFRSNTEISKYHIIFRIKQYIFGLDIPVAHLDLSVAVVQRGDHLPCILPNAGNGQARF